MASGLPLTLQLLQRNAAQMKPPVTWIEPPVELAASGLAPGRALCVNAEIRATLSAAMPATSALRASADPDQRHSVVFLPKSRARRQMLMHLAAACTASGGRLWVVGAKKEGAASAGRDLARFASGVTKLDAARHCMLFGGTVESTPGFELDDYWSRFEVEVAGEAMTLCSLPGVFSHGRLDPGTELLLQNLPESLPGKVLDFGSGCGVISIFAHRRGADQVEAVDVDEAASLSTTMTMAANDARNVASIAYPLPAPDRGYDWLLTNPPFHRGFKTTLEVTRRLIAEAPKRLKPRGELWLVANRFLDYRSDLARAFGRYATVSQERGFCVYRAIAR